MTQTLPRRDVETPPRGPRLPEIPGPLETAAMAWRKLRRMSTALVLLFAMAVASVVATFVPQEPIIPTTVADWREGVAGPGAAWARAFDALGFFDVFGSWWFVTITALLFVSLTGCLLPRYRAFARVARRRPVAGRNLGRLSNSRTFNTLLSPDEVIAAADRVLRRRRFRTCRYHPADTRSGAVQAAAERGGWREGGSLIFHTAFYVLLVGIVVGHSLGFTGQINLVEGSAFADTRLAYDAAEPGRYFGLGDHRGFVVALDDFDVSYYDNFTPRDFVSTVTISEGGVPVRTERVRVNQPVTHDGMKLFQARFGMAPRVEVSAGDTTLFSESVMLSDSGGIWTGAAKVAVGQPQIALDLALVPDGEWVDGRLVLRSPEANDPRLAVTVYAGEDLGLDRAVPASQFERRPEQIIGQAMLRPGEAADLLGGRLTVAFPTLDLWSGFQVTHAPGRWILLVAAGLILVGLIPSLYSYRRRIWVEAHDSGDGTEVVVAGVALQRKPRFAEEFAALAESCQKEIEG